MEEFVRDELERTPALRHNTRAGWAVHFDSLFSPENFINIWSFMDKFLDVEKSKALGQYFCRDIFANFAAETLRYILANEASPGTDPDRIDATARNQLLRAWVTGLRADNLKSVRRKHFFEITLATRGHKPKKANLDLSALERHHMLRPPPEDSDDELFTGLANAFATANQSSMQSTHLQNPNIHYPGLDDFSQHGSYGQLNSSFSQMSQTSTIC
ncbi:unnamed protein product [Zymoseptoria tritici ST99CH_1E4]|uniref:Uncharacterized protein n=1 Tax=Zymoseptoria tritici ST99CH_1E4 TaxID=1276532 RepID=A0A2H1FLI8_ZYMTR|nr:unnamed protein product [Zymoseptoria tritici ST99CH_1E4]